MGKTSTTKWGYLRETKEAAKKPELIRRLVYIVQG